MTHPRPTRPADTRPPTKPAWSPKYRTRKEAIKSAAYELRLAYEELYTLPARESAERAWKPGGPSVDELEQRIRQQFAVK